MNKEEGKPRGPLGKTRAQTQSRLASRDPGARGTGLVPHCELGLSHTGLLLTRCEGIKAFKCDEISVLWGLNAPKFSLPLPLSPYFIVKVGAEMQSRV